MKILIIEDEKKIANALRRGLENEGYSATVAYNGEEGFFLLHNDSFDLLILDVMLPGRDGLEILSTLRTKQFKTPVLILSAKDTVEDRVEGLEKGADDYLVKPFAFPELLARIRALLRRGKPLISSLFTIADLKMNLIERTVVRAERSILLTTKEFQLLEYLIKNQNNIVSREMLASEVWHETNRATPLDNVIDVHIARLRHKIDDPFDKPLLHTIRGIGFIIRENNP